MNIFNCRVCGHPCLMAEKPSQCPFCGARRQRMVPAAEYVPTAVGELSEKSRDNLQRALAEETATSAFYRGASKVADSVEGQALFTALARIEAEHGAIICRILGIPEPDELYETGSCSPSHKENLAESRKREERSIHLYRRFLDEASEERVKQILEAFVEIESDHLPFTG